MTHRSERSVRTSRSVVVVLFDVVQSLDVTGPVEVFAGAAPEAAGGPGAAGADAAYRIRTASLDGAPVRTSSGLTLVPDGALAGEPAPHTLLVPGGRGTRAPRSAWSPAASTSRAAGVSSGIDMGLTPLGRIAGDDHATAVQLLTEYDPQPPYDAGSPRKAPAALVEEFRAKSRFILR